MADAPACGRAIFEKAKFQGRITEKIDFVTAAKLSIDTL